MNELRGYRPGLRALAAGEAGAHGLPLAGNVIGRSLLVAEGPPGAAGREGVYSIDVWSVDSAPPMGTPAGVFRWGFARDALW
jgi:hypothetical protein